jgi:AraC-like DNA-binding protein
MLGFYTKNGRGDRMELGEFLCVIVLSGTFVRNGQVLSAGQGALWSVNEGEEISEYPSEGIVLSFSERTLLRAFAESGIRPDGSAFLMESPEWASPAELFFGSLRNMDHTGRSLAFLSLILSYTQEETLSRRAGESYIRFAEEYIREHLSESIQVDAIAEELGISRGYLRNVFFAAHGMSPREYLTEERLRAAKVYLKEGTYSVAETARLVGYEDALQFSRIFKKHTGLSPSAFTKENGASVSRTPAPAQPAPKATVAETRTERPARREKDPVWLF